MNFCLLKVKHRFAESTQIEKWPVNFLQLSSIHFSSVDTGLGYRFVNLHIVGVQCAMNLVACVSVCLHVYVICRH